MQVALSRMLFSLVALISFIALFVFFSVFLPLHVPGPLHCVLGWTHIVFALWLWINTVGNYILATFIDPGTVSPAASALTATTELPSTTSIAAPNTSQPSSTHGQEIQAQRLCGKCSAEKKALVHHCTTCGKCVEYMDHHCPFTMTCIGLHNFFHYMYFLFYASCGLLYASVLSYPSLVECWLSHNNDTCNTSTTMSLMFLPALTAFLSTFSLFSFHVLLLLANTTTVDCLVLVRTQGIWAVFKELTVFRRAKYTKAHTMLFTGRPWWHHVFPGMDHRVLKVSPSAREAGAFFSAHARRTAAHARTHARFDDPVDGGSKPMGEKKTQ
jgi:hypothetical protein